MRVCAWRLPVHACVRGACVCVGGGGGGRQVEMGRIIERDYYPDLPKLRLQLEWLEALESKDPRRIQATAARIRADTGKTPKVRHLTACACSGTVHAP